jgi:hypothetical protein
MPQNAFVLWFLGVFSFIYLIPLNFLVECLEIMLFSCCSLAFSHNTEAVLDIHSFIFFVVSQN